MNSHNGSYRSWLGAGASACLAAAILTGCATMKPKSQTGGEQAIYSTGVSETRKADPGVVRTDFKAEVGPAQRVGVHMDLARALESQGNYEAAAAEYQRALEEVDHAGRNLPGREASAQKALAQRRLGAALDRLGRFAQAEVHYRDALKLSPNDPKVWNDAGYSAYLQHRWGDAEQRLRTAVRLAPDDPKSRTNLGLCLAASGKTDKALEELSKVGGPAIGHANLAYILASLGKTEDARRHYQIALQFEPELRAAQAALAKLDANPNAPQPAQIAAIPATGAVADQGLKRTAASPAPRTTPTPMGPAPQ